MRVAMLIRSVTTHHVGGMELHAEDLRQWLVRAGHQVITITTTLPQGPSVVEDQWGETHYVESGRPGAYTQAWRRASVERLLSMHARDSFDVIASHGMAAYPYLAIRDRLPEHSRIPTVVISHGTLDTALRAHLADLPRHPVRAALKWLPRDLALWRGDRRYLPRADHVTVLSESDSLIMRRWFAVHPERISVIPNGVDVEALTEAMRGRAEARGQLGLVADETVIGVIGSLEPRKGQQFLLEALCRPPLSDAPHSIRLLFVGDGPAHQALQARTRHLGLADRVIFTGAIPHDEIPRLLSAMDIATLPSTVEGMPLSLLEVMACGLPVVASKVGAVPSVVEHEMNGLLVPPGDPDALARAISRMVVDPSFARRLGSRARARIVAQGDARQAMGRYEAALLLAATRRR